MRPSRNPPVTVSQCLISKIGTGNGFSWSVPRVNIYSCHQALTCSFSSRYSSISWQERQWVTPGQARQCNSGIGALRFSQNSALIAGAWSTISATLRVSISLGRCCTISIESAMCMPPQFALGSCQVAQLVGFSQAIICRKIFPGWRCKSQKLRSFCVTPRWSRCFLTPPGNVCALSLNSDWRKTLTLLQSMASKNYQKKPQWTVNTLTYMQCLMN